MLFSSLCLVAIVFFAEAHVARAADCNQNGVEDSQDIANGTSEDCNANGVPDECDILPQRFSFASPMSVPAGVLPSSVAAGDLDGDGDLDLAVTDSGADHLTILENTGGGVFGSSFVVPVAPKPREVIAADLDGDGDLDLAVWNDSSYPDPWGVFILINGGNATFAAPVRYNPGVVVKDMTSGDLDGDEDVDLALIGFASDITLLMNNGNGTFGDFVNTVGSWGIGVSHIIAADLNGDQDLDLAVADQFTFDVCVLLNQGAGTFNFGVTYTTPGMPAFVSAGDVDGDGDLDLAAANTNNNNVALLINNGSGAFSSTITLDNLSNPVAAVMVELDGDGALDVAVLDGSAVVFRGHGDGSFDPPQTFAAGAAPVAMTSVDVNADGRPDLVAANRAADLISVLNNEPAPFSRNCNLNLVPDECESDADQDGVPDLCDICPGSNDLLDTDLDGTSDCRDECPLDPQKVFADRCGCGRPDFPDCNSAPDAWPTSRHDNRRTGRSSVVASQTGSTLYTPKPAGGSAAAPGPTAGTAGPYGTVYFSNDTYLLAVNPETGALEWASPAIASEPVVGVDGTIYGTARAGGSPTDPGYVVALYPWGAVKWVVQTQWPSRGFSGLAVAPDGTVYGGYTAVVEQRLQVTAPKRFAISASGTRLWELTGSTVWSSHAPLIAPDGSLYMIGDDGTGGGWRLMKINPATGALIWSVVPTTGAPSQPLIADNGLIVLASGGNLPNGLHAFDPADGNEVWLYSFGEQTYAYAQTPVLLQDGEIVVIWAGQIYRISQTGHRRGIVPFPGTAGTWYEYPIVGGDNTLYVWSDHRVKAVSPYTGELKFAFVPVPDGQCLVAPQPTILRDGSLFVSWHWRVYCEDYTGGTRYVTLAGTWPVGIPDREVSKLTVRAVPNPSRSIVRFSIDLQETGRARLDVYDVMGRRVATVVDRDFPAGQHVVDWDGRGTGGGRVSSGVYFYRMSMRGLEASAVRGKLVLLR